MNKQSLFSEGKILFSIVCTISLIVLILWEEILILANAQDLGINDFNAYPPPGDNVDITPEGMDHQGFQCGCFAPTYHRSWGAFKY